MKNIAVLIYNVIIEYNLDVLNGILSFFEDKKDCRVIVAPVNAPHDITLGFDYQYWTSVEVLKSKDIDGIIIVTNSFTRNIEVEHLSLELQDFKSKPVVSVSVPLNIENSRYTSSECGDSYIKVIEHLKNKHNRKKIAFVAADKYYSQESIDRLEAFKTALEINNLEFNPDLVISGDFTPGTARDNILSRYKTKEDIDFDAIVCVNDYTAGGVLLAFMGLDVKVPDEVSVVGFDNSAFCLMTYPTLSSINQDVPGSSKKAAELLYRMVNGEEIPEKTETQCFPVYRQSCGCIESSTHSTAFIDYNGILHTLDENTREKERKDLLNIMDKKTNLYNLLNFMDSRVGMDKVSSIILSSMEVAGIKSIIACFYQFPVTIDSTDDFSIPEKAAVLLHIDTENNISESFKEEDVNYFQPGIHIGDEYFQKQPGGTFFIIPLYLREENYGYILVRISSDDHSTSTLYLKIISEIIIHAYEYTREEKNKRELLNRNHELNLESKTDELTKVFNRRGFIDYGQRLIDLSSSMGKYGVVFFCDLDGLKKINDTYGHETGDLAIQTEAKVLKKAFRDSDLVGRLSGDEFSVIAPGFPISKVSVLRERLIELNKQLSEEAGLPFILSISIGPIEYSESEKDLLTLLTQADKNLYEEKKIKHAQK